jgi:hypothetical protein
VGSLKQRAFGLDNRPKAALFECVADGLRCDRIIKVVVDVKGCLHCVIHVSSCNLTNQGTGVTVSELGWMPTTPIFFVAIQLLEQLAHCGLANAQLKGYIPSRKASREQI